MNIFDYLYESNGIHYFKEPTTLTIADIDKDQIYRGQAQKNFDKGKSYDPLPVLIFPDANPNPLPNEVFRWNGEKYYLDYNFKGQTVYKKATGEPVKVEAIGALPDNLTDIPYPGQFYIWSEENKNWIFDEKAKLESIRIQNVATKKELSSYAESRISLIQDEIDLEMTNGLAGAEADLKAWKKYRILVDRTDITAWKKYRILVDRTDITVENPDWPRRPDLKE